MHTRNLVAEPEFVAKLKSQDEGAFKSLYLAYSGITFSIAMSLLGNRLEAEDSVQDIFFKVYRALPQFRGNKLTTWIATIAKNHCYDKLRQAKRAVESCPESIEELEIMQPTASDELPDFLSECPILEREVIVLRKVEGLSYREIAQITGKTEGTLRNMVLKCLRLLRLRGSDENQ